MFRKKRKKKKASSLLYVDASNKSIDRALAEFKKRVKNSNLLKELREREFYEKHSVTARRLRKLRLRKVKKLHTN